ncbi:sugar ABC transporter ATP-binding protein [soil metagenome]
MTASPVTDAPTTPDAPPASGAPILRMRSISKRFPGTLALDDVDLEVRAGSIHGLLGENGAGKSTLLKILAGDQPPSSGSIEFSGREVHIADPAHAHELGIGIVYQELSLLPNLSVAHNLSLGQEPTKGLAIDEEVVRRTAVEALARIGVRTIRPERLVGSLSLAERQLVEIAKVLTLQQARILIFDEPTAALNHHDVERLFAIMRGLRAEGVALIFVSHRYREVLEICDLATVLRNGRVVATVTGGEATLERLVELTLGQRAETTFDRSWHTDGTGELVLDVRGLSVAARVSEVDLQVRRGEIVGVCGLLGSGQNELARAICGDAADVDGDIRLVDRDGVPATPREAVRAGAGLITENRQDEGLFPSLSVMRNISVSSVARLVWSGALRLVRPSVERTLVRSAADRTGIAPGVLQRPVMTLSGGNQQKSILARWLMRGCSLLVCLEPTRGVDVGAKAEIYRELEGLARDGTGILVVSTDLPEVLGICDRILVMFRGRIEAQLDPRTASEQDLLLAMQGGLAGEHEGLISGSVATGDLVPEPAA